MNNLGKIIKEKRIEKNLSPLNLANMLDIDIEEVLRWEEGTSEPSVDLLKRLALVFSVSVEAFFKEEETNEFIEERNSYQCLWCEGYFKEEELFQKEPYLICLNCHLEKEEKLKGFKRGLVLEEEKIKRLTKKYSKNTVLINLFMITILFFTIFPFLNNFNEYREYLFLGGIYFVISVVSYITLLHFKGFIYKYSLLIVKRALNYPKRLFEAKIKGLIWSLLTKLIFGIVLIVLAALIIIIGSLVLILLSPIFLPITLIKYRRSASYDYL